MASADEHDRSRPDRWSSAQKSAAVVRLMKGEPATTLSQELGVSVRRLERWQSDFLAGGAAALARKRRKTAFMWFTHRSKTFLQWGALLFMLLFTIVFLALFLSSGSPQ